MAGQYKTNVLHYYNRLSIGLNQNFDEVTQFQ